MFDHLPMFWAQGGELVDGEVWGRGAIDMLNITASQAVAFRRIADSGFRPRGTLVYLAVADEEIGVVAAPGHRAGVVRRQQDGLKHVCPRASETIADRRAQVRIPVVLTEQVARVARDDDASQRCAPVLTASDGILDF